MILKISWLVSSGNDTKNILIQLVNHGFPLIQWTVGHQQPVWTNWFPPAAYHTSKSSWGEATSSPLFPFIFFFFSILKKGPYFKNISGSYYSKKYGKLAWTAITSWQTTTPTRNYNKFRTRPLLVLCLLSYLTVIPYFPTSFQMF